MDDLERRLVLMDEIADAASNCLKSFFGKDLDVVNKGDVDLVTEADRETESLILKKIGAAFPLDEVLAEESGRREGESGWKWIVDPLDGTTNFACGLPHFCVSIGLVAANDLVAGVVMDPMKNECFRAVKGCGTTLNGEPVQVRQVTRLGEALTVTGFPYNRRQRMETLLRRVNNILLQTRGLRRLGSAALDLAYIASGRLDVFIEDGLNPWDIAAGILLVREAGGQVTDFQGSDFSLSSGQVIAANATLAHSAQSLV